MSDEIDRAQAHEEQLREDALRDQARRAGLAGKTAADSATHCQAEGCEVELPEARRKAVPGCQLCTTCQSRQEHSKRTRAR